VAVGQAQARTALGLLPSGQAEVDPLALAHRVYCVGVEGVDHLEEEVDPRWYESLQTHPQLQVQLM
jgi:hypothetical protein